MIDFFLQAAEPQSGFDINLLLTLVGGGAGVAAVWKIVGLIIDKLVPSRTDKRSDIESTFKVLSDTLEILRKDKELDQEYLTKKQARITELETDADRDYTVLTTLRHERDELAERLRMKDAHLHELVIKIHQLGAAVSFDASGNMHVDMPEGIDEPIRPVTP